MIRRAVFATGLLLLCGSLPAEEEPKWLKDARARESKSLKLNPFASKDQWFKASTPGKVTNTVEKTEGSYSVEIDVGADSKVYCEVYPEGIDLANALRNTFTNAVKEIETSQGKIEARVLEKSDAGAHGAVPYISLAWLYRVTTPEGPMLGALQQSVMEKGKLGVYCAQNELGYTRTFAAITKAFAETLEIREPAAAPYFVEIATASMSGTEVGVSVTTLERDSEGDTRARQMTSMFIATGDGALHAQDATQVDWLRPDGSLINSANTDVSNGELANNLALRLEDENWIVEGEVQGKAVKTPLPKDSQPGSWLTQLRELRKILAEPDAVGREHTANLWIDENPEKLTAVKTRILAKKGDKHFTAKGDIGSMSANLTLEAATGLVSAGDFTIGPIKLQIERVYLSGGF